MFDFGSMVAAAARTAGDRPIVAAPYPLGAVICRDLAAQGLIGGYIAETAPEPQRPDPLVAGWWTDRSAGVWFLRQAASPTMLMLGVKADHRLDGGLLLEARLKGIRRILYVGEDGAIVHEVDVAAELMRLLASVAVPNPVHRLSYAEMFAEMYDLIGDRLRLPPAAFVPGRVLILIGSLRRGGAERQAAYTAAELARRCPGRVFIGVCAAGGAADSYKPIIDQAGVATRLVTFDTPDGEWGDLVEGRNHLIQRYGSLGVYSIFQMILSHALMIHELCPEIVHTWLDYSNTLGGIAADLVGVPRLVMSGRSLAPDNFTIFQPYMAPAYHAVLARRDVVLLNNSHAGAGDYARWLELAPERFRVIANGHPPPPAPGSRTGVRAALGIAEDAIVIGSLMGFREEKRPMLWLEMAKLLSCAHPQLRFVVFGDGALLARCRAFVEEEGLVGVVSLPGETADMWGALSAMDIFVLTSRAEGLPNAMIEAQLAGLPVVCTGTGGMYETFTEGETGFGVHEDTPAALARGGGRGVQQAGWPRRGGPAAARRAPAAFGIERMIDETVAAYRSAKDESTNFPPDWQERPQQWARLGGIVRDGDDVFAAELPGHTDAANLMLWEDETALEPTAPNCAADLSGGRYRISGSRIRFSSRDATDPRFNGRTYWLRPQHPGNDEVPLEGAAMRHEAGHCYIVDLGSAGTRSHLQLWEDNRRLRPGDCAHDEIRALGGGRYSVWGEQLYLSTADNSDPRSNGRHYLVRREKRGSAPEIVRSRRSPVAADDAFRQLLANVPPRPDFVPGRVVHVGGSRLSGVAQRQIVHILSGLRRHPIESAQLLCRGSGPAATDQHDFHVSALRAAGVPVRDARRYLGEAKLDLPPRGLRAVQQALPRELVTDIGDLYWEFVELRPEVVHAWGNGNLEGAGIAAALAGVPRVVLGARDLNPAHFDAAPPHLLPAYRALIALPQVTMINNSLAGRDDFAEWLGVDRGTIRIICDGVDLANRPNLDPASRLALRRQYRIGAEAFLVGGVFCSSFEKNPLLWIETAALVARQLPSARFTLFDSGDLRQKLEQTVTEMGLRETVTFAGAAESIPDAFAMMDVLLLASASAGIPNAALEAQWVGTPVVAAGAGGTCEAVEHGATGWIVDQPCARALAERIVWLHRNPSAQQRAQRLGPNFVRAKFAVERMIDQMVALYRLPNSPK